MTFTPALIHSKDAIESDVNARLRQIFMEEWESQNEELMQQLHALESQRRSDQNHVVGLFEVDFGDYNFSSSIFFFRLQYSLTGILRAVTLNL